MYEPIYEHVYSSTQLKTNLREIKDIAEHDMVYITEHGVIKYFFCSVDVYNRFLADVDRKARWQCNVELALSYSDEGYGTGRDTDVAERVRASANFIEELELSGFALGRNEVRAVIEYLSDEPTAGKRLGPDIERKGDDPLPAYKFWCAGHDVIYEYDSSADEVLLCGFTESLDEPRRR